MSQDLPRVFGNYTLLKMLARGGMGEIYLARTAGMTGFEKYYAVKKLLKKFTHDNDVGARFVDEAKLGARLQHPNIVQVYDLGRVQDELYMATEFVDGFDLRRVLRFCHEKKKRIPLDIALFIVREILSGLAYAHRQVDAEGHSIDLIHRDISPQNVLVSFEGEVKIIDFGLAKSTQRSQETQANVLLGNFGYMSPEQARGQNLDVRTDVYSAGIVLFELVTSTKRFIEENALRLLEMVARPTPILPSDRQPQAPRAIDRIYERATKPTKDERYQSAEAFRDDVTTALHKINPKASRENLAQFLNHLFLGGAPPAAVDPKALDKSLAIRVRDLHEASKVFQATAEAPPNPFLDEGPQTASHPILREARVGDVFTHEQLTVPHVVPAPVPVPLPTPVPTSPLGAGAEARAAPPPLLDDNERLDTPVSMSSPLAEHLATSVSGDPVQKPFAAVVSAPGEQEPESLPDEALVVDISAPDGGSPYEPSTWANVEPTSSVTLDMQEQLLLEERLQQQLDAQTAASKAALRGQGSTGSMVVSTVAPPRRKPLPSQEVPSIVVANDVTWVGGSAVGSQTLKHQTQLSDDLSSERDVFAPSALHESLIIDFASDAPEGPMPEPQAPAPPVAAPPSAAASERASPSGIRPAAQPVGKRVTPSVAQVKTRSDTSGKRRR